MSLVAADLVANLVAAVREGLAALADPSAAGGMQQYMKSSMPFRGVPKPARTRLLREIVTGRPVPERGELDAALDELWTGAEYREERYLVLALAAHRTWAREQSPDRLPQYRGWIVTGAWWDFTDEIASRLVGPLLRSHPAELTPVMRGWASDPDRWLRRTSVICQLGSGAGTDLDLLRDTVDANIADPDFFLRKGIGWALRQHTRVDPEWVREFVAARPGLSPLSRREALRHLQE